MNGRVAQRLEEDPPDLERYEVASRLEIVALLRALAESRMPVTVYFDRGADFIVSNVLQVNPDFEELILDRGADEAANRRLLKAARLTVVSFLDHIRLQFQAERAEETSYERRPALRLRLPGSLLRVQRRNNFRIRTPLARPIAASFRDPADRARRASLRILDLSCGGVSLVAGEGEIALEPGTVLTDCRIDLPEVGVLNTVLEVRHADRYEEGVRANLRRYGCQFVGLPPALASAVQRYITRTERAVRR